MVYGRLNVVYLVYYRYIAYMKKPISKTLLRFALSVVISVGSVLLDRHVASDIGNAVKHSLTIITNDL